MHNKLLQLLRDNAPAERKPLALLRNDAAPNDATLFIYDVIDPWWGVSAEQVAMAISGLSADTTLHLRINSPGGDVFEGRAIRTHIAQFAGKTIAHVDGLAASAATTVADGADEIEIVDGGFYMIHEGWTIALGNKRELRKTSDLLEKVDQAIVADYAARTGVEISQLNAWLEAETWFSADEAVENGFATRKAEAPAKDAKNATGRRWNLSAYDKPPKALTETVQTPGRDDIDYAAHHAHNLRRLQVLQFA
jgi:ATP-dependent Clp protease protease subunit